VFKGEDEQGYSVTTEIFSEKGYDFKADPSIL
jgi:hypothetical protein